jgi:hypothetical protein
MEQSNRNSVSGIPVILLLTNCSAECYAQGGTADDCAIDVSVNALSQWFNYFSIHTTGLLLFLMFGLTSKNVALWKALFSGKPRMSSTSPGNYIVSITN